MAAYIIPIFTMRRICILSALYFIATGVDQHHYNPTLIGDGKSAIMKIQSATKQKLELPKLIMIIIMCPWPEFEVQEHLTRWYSRD